MSRKPLLAILSPSLLAAAVITLMLTLTACIGGGGEEPPPIVVFSLDKSKMALFVGMEETLLLPAAEQNKAVEWISSNTNVAAVSPDGAVTAIAPGEADITVRTLDGAETATCVLTVLNLDSDVYVSGCEERSGFMWVEPIDAKVWKNGLSQNLTGGDSYLDPHANAHSVFVYDGDVYVAGTCQNPQYDDYRYEAAVWKNGVIQRLGGVNNELASVAESIFVFNGDVYVAGYEYEYEDFGQSTKAILWKNGEAQYLSGGSKVTWAGAVFVSGGDVYVAGYEVDLSTYNSTVILWKNGEAQYLSDGSRDARAGAVFVSGGDVYVTGGEANGQGVIVATVWKNGTAQRLGDANIGRSVATSVFVYGGDVYVAGIVIIDEQNYWGMVWKNGAAQRLSDASDMVWPSSIFVSGNDVYVAGNEYTSDGFYGSSFAALWVNGRRITLSKNKTDPDYRRAEARSVFVK